VTHLYSDDAELYDIAFDWDIEDEADWIVERLETTSVLEPGCGSGRMLETLARRGLEVVGIDLSPQMLAIARRRLGDRALLLEADMTDFELERRFGGAVSPINTLLHLTPDQLARHLECVRRHLDDGGKYLVQVGVIEPAAEEPFPGSHWEAERGETRLRVDWTDEKLDVAAGRSTQRSRIEVLAGPRAGDVVEEIHQMTAWTTESWARAVAASPFVEAATYDGAKAERPPVAPTATGGLIWHELVAG
jgi:SAM-dependent methyltransferase